MHPIGFALHRKADKLRRTRRSFVFQYTRRMEYRYPNNALDCCNKTLFQDGLSLHSARILAILDYDFL